MRVRRHPQQFCPRLVDKTAADELRAEGIVAPAFAGREGEIDEAFRGDEAAGAAGEFEEPLDRFGMCCFRHAL
jgi:hypothetical protein